jgi:drug/metabolite transporter (DMT)-like permease
MQWLLLSLTAAFLWATVNFVDKFIVDKVSENKGIGALVLFSGLIGIPVAIVSFFLFYDQILSTEISAGVVVLASGVFYLLYVLGYLYAISKGEVSSVVPQLLLSPIISLFLGYFFLKEELSAFQLFGSTLIISGAIILTLNLEEVSVIRKFKVLLLILAASFCLSLNAIIFKYAATNYSMSFGSTIFWEQTGFILFSLVCFLFIRSYRDDFLQMVRRKGGVVITTNIFSELLTLSGNLFAHYATLLVPVALVQITSDGIQPLFILILGILLTKFAPNISEERSDAKSLISKLIAITIMFVGVVCVNI